MLPKLKVKKKPHPLAPAKKPLVCIPNPDTDPIGHFDYLVKRGVVLLETPGDYRRLTRRVGMKDIDPNPQHTFLRSSSTRALKDIPYALEPDRGTTLASALRIIFFEDAKEQDLKKKRVLITGQSTSFLLRGGWALTVFHDIKKGRKPTVFVVRRAPDFELPDGHGLYV